MSVDPGAVRFGTGSWMPIKITNANYPKSAYSIMAATALWTPNVFAALDFSQSSHLDTHFQDAVHIEFAIACDDIFGRWTALPRGGLQWRWSPPGRSPKEGVVFSFFPGAISLAIPAAMAVLRDWPWLAVSDVAEHSQDSEARHDV